MPETKVTKLIARRIDIGYLSRPSWFRWWRRWLCVLTFLTAVAWSVGILIGNLRHGRFDHLLNPAPVTLVHAHFENNCQACHDADGKGGFRKAVSDNACLNCHDGPSHHPSADLNPGKVGLPHLASLGNPLKAADCTACHVEHRGKEANLASDDRFCVQCHENLGAHGGKASHVTNTISTFDGKGHPQFGRALPTTMPGGAWADTTWGKTGSFHFNHKKHLSGKDPEHGLPIQNCATCHAVEESRSLPTGRRAYMRPVTYEQHCKTCHPLALPKTEGLPPDMALGLPLVHDRLEIVRGQLNDLPREYLNLWASPPPAAPPSVAVTGPARSPEAEEKAHRDLLGGKSPEQWGKDQAGKLAALLQSTQGSFVENAYADRLDKLVDRYKAWNRPEISKDVDDAKDDLTDQVKKSVPAQTEFVVAMVNAKTKCSKCHELTGEPPIIYEKLLELTLKSPAPTTLPTRLKTAPTRIPSTPRRWFAQSEFAHTPHRDINCLTCHTGIDKDEDDGVARLPTMNSCVECHHPPTADSRGSGNQCITCHVFHDRANERPATGPLRPVPDAAMHQ